MNSVNQSLINSIYQITSADYQYKLIENNLIHVDHQSLFTKIRNIEINELIPQIPIESSMRLLELYRDVKFPDNYFYGLIVSDFLLRIDTSETILDLYNQRTGEKSIYKTVPSEVIQKLEKVGTMYLMDKSRPTYINGVLVPNKVYDLIHYAKIVDEVFKANIDFTDFTKLDNLAFNFYDNYFERFGWEPKFFADSFLDLPSNIVDGNCYKLAPESIEEHTSSFIWYFDNSPSSERRRNQEQYFNV
jgi:hypothetical protein